MTERSLLADAVAGFFADRCSAELVAKIEAGYDAAPLWAEVEELGFTTVAVPENLGGGDGSLVDALTVLRAAGRHAVPLPLAETGFLAGWALAAAGLSVPVGRITVAPARLGDRLTLRFDGDVVVLDGHAARVPWARDATQLVALAEDEDGQLHVAAVPPAAVEIVPGTSLAGEPRDDVSFAAVHVAAGAAALAPFDRDVVQLRGALARSVLMLGALERILDLTVGWSKDREQFGRPIARFQAVQHMLAEMARDVGLTRAAVELAVTAADEGAGALEIASAKIVAGRAARSVSAQAHQVHGAIGVTRECTLSVFTRRLWSWREEFGTERDWSYRIAQQAYASPDGIWALVTSGRLPVGTVKTA